MFGKRRRARRVAAVLDRFPVPAEWTPVRRRIRRPSSHTVVATGSSEAAWLLFIAPSASSAAAGVTAGATAMGLVADPVTDGPGFHLTGVVDDYEVTVGWYLEEARPTVRVEAHRLPPVIEG